MREVIRFFLKSSRPESKTKLLLATAVSLSLLGAVANVFLLALVTRILSHSLRFQWSFVGALVVLGVALGTARGLASYLLTRVTMDTLVALRLQLCSEITAAPLAVIERVGSAKLTAVFTESMPAISNALVQLPNVVLYSIVAAGTVGYLVWLSWKALLIVLFAGAAEFMLYRRINGNAQKEFGKAYIYYKNVLKGFRELLDGAKELKLHRARRKAHLASALAEPMHGLARHRLKSSSLYGAAEGWSTAGMFLTVAVVLAVARRTGAEIETGFVVALLYLMPLVQSILSTLPAFSQAQSAITVLQALRNDVSQASDISEAEWIAVAPWSELSLQDVGYRYEAEDGDSGFQVGPLDLTIRAGETVFVTGGNGSGKTTLLKVLTGLHQPQSGRIAIDDVSITARGLDDYRQHFSAVFFDFHLFDRLHGVNAPDDEATEYLRHLRLDHKVRVINGELSTVNLSQGQKKRLALLTAYLEDRPIYIFDEWAADQDIEFRDFFYHEILAGLKKRNKTVIVVTHDDRYFHLADRLVKLECGRIVGQHVEEKLREQLAASV